MTRMAYSTRARIVAPAGGLFASLTGCDRHGDEIPAKDIIGRKEAGECLRLPDHLHSTHRTPDGSSRTRLRDDMQKSRLGFCPRGSAVRPGDKWAGDSFYGVPASSGRRDRTRYQAKRRC
jgi:hypothetical protein